MAPKGNSKKSDKLSATDKRTLFWQAVDSQKAKDLRDALTNTGIEAQTRNDQGFTSIMYACVNNKPQALDILLDWYKRRKVLRQKGWVNLKDDDGRTAAMMAAERGNIECIEVLYDAECGTDFNLKDFSGKTARDYCEKSKRKDMIKLYDEILNPVEVEENFEELEQDFEHLNVKDLKEMTSTQINKLKKKRFQELEQGKPKNLNKKEIGAQNKKEPLDMKTMPKPFWQEIDKVLESIQQLRELKEISVVRKDTEDQTVTQGIDPALWYLNGINRLEIHFPKGIISSLPENKIGYLFNLQTLILSHNSLKSIPDDISELLDLKSLDLSYNELECLPRTMSNLKSLELLNLENNHLGNNELTSIYFLENITTLNISSNKLTDLNLDFENKQRLKTLSASNNQLESLSNRIVFLQQLDELVLENNSITEIPKEICQLKKVKTLKLDQNPIKDQKVVKMLNQEGKLKDLWKYFQKLGGQDSKVEPKDYSNTKNVDKEIQTNPDDNSIEENESLVQDDNANDDSLSTSSWDSDCSFDIRMEEL